MSYNGSNMYFSYTPDGLPFNVVYQNTQYVYVLNLQGDVMAILTEAGTPVVEYTYDAWGNVLSVTGSMASTLGQLNPLRYRSYVFDRETQLYYLQSRYYDPELGRFINADGLVSIGQGILGNKKSDKFHQNKQRNGGRNRKYVVGEWFSSEVVYYSDGTLNNEPEDRGTFNVYSGSDPIKNVVIHGVFDVIPYMVWGNSLDDSTTIIERVIMIWE